MLQIRFRNYTSVEINERQLKYIPNKIRYTRDCMSLHLLHFGLVLSIYHTPAPSSLLILIKIVVRRHQLDSTKTPKANCGKYVSLKRHARKTKRNPRIACYTGSRVPLRRINTAVAHKYFSFYHHAFVGFKDHCWKAFPMKVCTRKTDFYYKYNNKETYFRASKTYIYFCLTQREIFDEIFDEIFVNSTLRIKFIF